jgi:arabinogalactan endo-1,4-beta-galactosidase
MKMLVVGVCCLYGFLLPSSAFSHTEPFILGADISWIDQRESEGVTYADNGTVKDIFLILKEHKFNWIRLRLFVDPTAKVTGSSESPYSSKGFCNLAHTLKMAKRAKKAGFNVLLDFHYSDVWADPGKQFKPVSWEGLSFDKLKEKVRTYTKETLEACKADSVLPDMVQVGNEVVGGMIWPDGKSSTMANFAALVNSGIDGVKDVSPNIKIMIHSISENSPSAWLTSLINAGVKRIDVFGLSYYSEWHGTPDDLKKRLDEVAKNHTVKIAIAEYADNHRKVNDIVHNLPDEKGIGTFCWEPEEWMDAMFDWKNNRRETNSTIDLYPVMSKDFGNDALTGVASICRRQPGGVLSLSDKTTEHIVTVAHTARETAVKRRVLNLHGKILRTDGVVQTGASTLPKSNFYIIVDKNQRNKTHTEITVK